MNDWRSEGIVKGNHNSASPDHLWGFKAGSEQPHRHVVPVLPWRSSHLVSVARTLRMTGTQDGRSVAEHRRKGNRCWSPQPTVRRGSVAAASSGLFLALFKIVQLQTRTLACKNPYISPCQQFTLSTGLTGLWGLRVMQVAGTTLGMGASERPGRLVSPGSLSVWAQMCEPLCLLHFASILSPCSSTPPTLISISHTWPLCWTILFLTL